MREFRNLPVLTAARAEPISQDQMPVIDQDSAPPGLSLAQLWAIARAHRWQTVMIAAVIVILTAGVAKIMPKTYAATATLMVNYENNLIRLAARGIQTGPVPAYISTEMELMQSSAVLLPVVDKLNLTADQNYAAGYRSGAGDPRDWAKDALSKGLEVEQGRFGSQLIYVTASARDPVLAASIANAVADTYLEQQRQRVHGPASERAKNYAEELAELKHKVSVAQDAVTSFRQRSGVTDAAAPDEQCRGRLAHKSRTAIPGSAKPTPCRGSGSRRGPGEQQDSRSFGTRAGPENASSTTKPLSWLSCARPWGRRIPRSLNSRIRSPRHVKL